MSGFIRHTNKDTYRVYASSGRKVEEFSSYEDAERFLNDFNSEEEKSLKFLRNLAKDANLHKNEKIKSTALYAIAELTGDLNTKADLSYSSIMRDLKDKPEERKLFMETFKKAFDDAFINELDNPEEIALFAAMKEMSDKKKDLKEAKAFSNIDNRLYKLGQSAVEMGSVENAGVILSQIIRFIMKRVDYVKRPIYIMKLKNKIWYLDEFNIASKKTPQTAALGQAITFMKTILQGHKPDFIRKVISEVVRNL
jgi:site-specific recombinase